MGLIWAGFLGAHFTVGEGDKIVLLSRLKLVRIMLETGNSVLNYRNYTLKCQGPLNFPEVIIFFGAKSQHFETKIIPLHKAIA